MPRKKSTDTPAVPEVVEEVPAVPEVTEVQAEITRQSKIPLEERIIDSDAPIVISISELAMQTKKVIELLKATEVKRAYVQRRGSLVLAIAVVPDDDDDYSPSCPYTSADECAMAAERSVAGTDTIVTPCPVHSEA